MFYVEKIIENAISIDKKEAAKFFENVKNADIAIIVAEGRSEGAINIGLHGMPNIISVKDIGFPARTISKAAPILEERYKKIALIVNSGSGETSATKQVTQELAEYIKNNKSEKYTINAITSKPNSTIGKLGEKFGTLIVVKGRNENANEPKFFDGAIMNDIYELATMLFLQKTKESIKKEQDYQTVFTKIQNEGRIIKKIINDFTTHDIYQELLKKLETRAKITIGGMGPARNVAKMTAIRMQHIKRILCGDCRLAGPFAPRTEPGDILLLISWSGETATILNWAREHKKMGGYIYSIVGQESPLSRESHSITIEDADDETFDQRTAFALSPLPISLLEKIWKRGYKIPDSLIKYVTHTQFQ